MTQNIKMTRMIVLLDSKQLICVLNFSLLIIIDQLFKFKKFYTNIKSRKKDQVIFKNNLTYKAPLVGSRSNRFWKDLKKFRE